MRTLYLDLGMGAAGDMLTAALLELLPEPESFVAELNALALPNVEFRRESVDRCGICGTHMTVLVHGAQEEAPHEHEHHHEHHHHTLHDVRQIVCGQSALSEKVKQDIMAVYALLAEAESAAHGVPITQIHFHEVGTMDAIADITAVCMLMERLAPDAVLASPVHVGSGHVRCAHGVLPVPAPACAYLLRGVPVYGGRISGELCTPTGAALLRHFVTKFTHMPTMRISAIGYGMGTKEFEQANCVRALLGEDEQAQEAVFELSCNVDDMSGEKIGFAMERLFDAGALEVYTLPIGMKKSRPGILLCALCRETERDAVIGCLFKHTSTIGIREQPLRRYTLRRTVEALDTPYGTIRRKCVSGYGVKRSKLEYEDLAKAALANDLSLCDLERRLTDAGHTGSL